MYHYAERMNDVAESKTMRSLVGSIRANVTLRRRLPQAWRDVRLFARFGTLEAIIDEISTMSPASNDLVVALMSPTATGLRFRSEVLLCGLAPIAIDKTTDRARIGHLLTELAAVTASTEDLSFTMHAAHGLVTRAMNRSRRERARLYDSPVDFVADPTPATAIVSDADSTENAALTGIYLEEFRAALGTVSSSITLDAVAAKTAGVGDLSRDSVYRWRRQARPLFDQLTAA